MEQNRSVDVLIPTYKPDQKCVQLVRRLLKQSVAVHRIYLIDTDTGIFPEELYGISDRVLIHRILPEVFDHGGTRNLGAELSDAEILVYMTQDAVPADEYLIERLVEGFEEERVGAVYARQLPSEDCQLIERYTRGFNYPKTSRLKSAEDLPVLGIKTYFCSNVCAAYRRDVYAQMGGFVKKTIFNEDMILAGKMIQNGWNIYYAADAKVIHSHNYNCRQQFHRNFDLAVSQADHPEIFEGVPSEGEGLRLVKDTAVYLIKIKKPWLILSLVWKSGFKYLGYQLGKHYKKLPRWLVLKCTMNPRYWKET
ncbi:MAG: glycosyltransferase family 2 protein [Eubacteriales bacterium]|nr:glycosyltransferase family 2 protein [Eubacteriales bacterium]